MRCSSHFYVIDHTAQSEHRWVDATLSKLQERYRWARMGTNVSVFGDSCTTSLDEHSTEFPDTSLYSTRRNELLNFDYLYMGAIVAHMRYISVLKEDLSSYLWNGPTSSADTSTTATGIERCTKMLTAMSLWVRDRGSISRAEQWKH